MLWSDLVSRVGASHRDNLIAPFPLGQKCPRKITMKLWNYETTIISSKAMSWSMARSHSHVTVNISMIHLWFKTFKSIIILIFPFCCYNLSYICHNNNLNKEKYVRNFEAEINLNQIAYKVLVLLLSISETASNFGLLKKLGTKVRRKWLLRIRQTDHCPMLTLVRKFLPGICRSIPLTVDVKYIKTLLDSTDHYFYYNCICFTFD